MAQHKAGAPSILGLMVTRGSRWVIHSWLQRHVAMLELLAVLDGSPPGSRDARWTEHHCSLYSNVHYRLEQSENLTSPTDQTARDSATSILRRMGVALDGRWIFLAHPDEFFVQDLRELIVSMAARDPRATVVLFDILYAMPTPEERDSINRTSRDDATDFSIVDHLTHCDALFPFREPRLFRWTPGTRWGTRHGLTTPQVHPGHRPWPTARDAALRHTPFYVHFKVHDFDVDAVELRSDREHGGAWVAFRSSGFQTGLARHRAHGSRFRPSSASDAWHYYERADRPPSDIRGEIRKRCAGGALPRCRVPWRAGAHFS